MTAEVVPLHRCGPPDPGRAELARMAAQHARITDEDLAARTVDAYQWDWDRFTDWCAGRAQPLPAAAETVTAHLQDLADGGAKLATIRRRASGISHKHAAEGLDNPIETPDVRRALNNLTRRLGPTAQGRPDRADPVRLPTLGLLLAAAAEQPPPVAARDRALLLLGWACALRRSEIGELAVADVVDDGDGLRITIRRSKTDQEGQGAVLAVPYGRYLETCPVRAWRAWLAQGLADRDGPAFPALDRWGHPSGRGLSGAGVTTILRRLAAAAGLDPRTVRGHSLRSGFISEAVRRGVPAQDVMAQSRHKSRVVFDSYVRSNQPMTDSAAGKVGL